MPHGYGELPVLWLQHPNPSNMMGLIGSCSPSRRERGTPDLCLEDVCLEGHLGLITVHIHHFAWFQEPIPPIEYTAIREVSQCTLNFTMQHEVSVKFGRWLHLLADL